MKLTSLKTLPEEPNVHNPNITKKVMIKNGQVPHLTNLTEAKLPPGAIASEHAHQDMYEVFFTEIGMATAKINGQVFELPEGSCITVEPGEAHEISNQSKEDAIIKYLGIEIK